MSGVLPRGGAAAMLFFLGVVLSAAPAGSDDDKPLPDTRTFLEETRRNARSDRLLLEQYTFTEKRTENRLDGKGAVKSSKRRTFEVYPSAEPGQMYRRLVARDGVPLSAAELAEEDRRQAERTEKSEKKRADEDASARARREAKEAEDRREEDAVIDDLFRMDDFVMEGRETVDGRPTIVISFAPRPGYKPATAGGKILQKVAGRAWIDEEDRQIARIEARLLENLGVGPVGVARLQKGATSYFYRRKVNDEIWLPREARFRGEAKVLLFFGGAADALFEYGDYRKFSVSTDSAITPVQ
jgi:hypothetical protein